MADRFTASFADIPETEGFPNNFRRAVVGAEMGVNQIRCVHPTQVPGHAHPDAEQAVIVTSGEIEMVIDGETHRLRAGELAIVPRDVQHTLRSVTDATFIEVFAPRRVQNLAGFLGHQGVTPGEE